MERKHKLKRTPLGLRDALTQRYGFDPVPFIQEGLESGRTMVSLAEELGTSPPVVFGWLRELGYRTQKTIVPIAGSEMAGVGR